MQIDFDRMDRDRAYSFLYPICECMGLDTGEIVADLRLMVRKFNLNEWDLVLAKRRELTEKWAGIRSLSD